MKFTGTADWGAGLDTTGGTLDRYFSLMLRWPVLSLVVVPLAVFSDVARREQVIHLRLVDYIELHLDLLKFFLLARLAPEFSTANRLQLLCSDFMVVSRGGLW